MPPRKILSLLTSALLLGGFFYVGIWPFIAGGGEVQKFCLSLPKDAPLVKVHAQAKQLGFRMSIPDKEGRVLVHDPASMGRFICELQFAQEQLVSARYSEID